MTATTRDPVRRGAMKFFIAIAIVTISMLIAYPERLAAYRSNSLCVSIKNAPIQISHPGIRQIQTRDADGNITIEFIHSGALPFSRYVCAVRMKETRVANVEPSHEWSRR
ncbi:MAG: hypothetical protein V4582_11830 [Pseudomonadota bacterium]